MGPQALIKKMVESGPKWLDKLPEMPELAYEALQSMKNISRLSMREQKKRDRPIEVARRLNRAKWRSIFLGLGFGFAITAVTHYLLIHYAVINPALNPSAWPMVAGLGFSAIVALIISGLVSS